MLSSSKCYCFNPDCLQPQNSTDEICRSCGSKLLLGDRYYAVQRLSRGTFLGGDLSHFPPLPCVIHQTNRSQGSPPQNLLTLLGHPQLPTLLDVVDGVYSYTIYAYIAGPNLATVLAQRGTLTAADVWQVLAAVLPILQVMHSVQVIHGDIKPENLIWRLPAGLSQIRAEDIVLVDLGAATILTQPLESSRIGSATYAAPEQIEGTALLVSDLYSLGVTCIHLLTGIHPFELWDVVNDRWGWRNYWLTTAPDNRLAQLLDRLIEPNWQQRCPNVETAIALLERLGGQKIIPALKQQPIWFSETLSGHDGLFANVNAVAINADCTQIASASDDRSIRLWQLPTGQSEGILLGHSDFVKAVAYHPTMPQVLVSGSRDRTLKQWDLHHQIETRTYVGHEQSVNAVAFTSDGLLVSGSTDKTVKLWHDTGELLGTLAGHRLGVQAIACSPTSPLVVSGSADTTVQVWDLIAQTAVQKLTLHTGIVRAVAFSSDGKWLATGGEDRQICLWETTNWKCVKTLSGHPWDVAALVFSPDGMLISGSWDKTLKLWDLAAGQEIAKLSGHQQAVLGVAVAGKTVVSSSADRTLKIWQIGEHKLF